MALDPAIASTGKLLKNRNEAPGDWSLLHKMLQQELLLRGILLLPELQNLFQSLQRYFYKSISGNNFRKWVVPGTLFVPSVLQNVFVNWS